jgi:hypothetical protein
MKWLWAFALVALGAMPAAAKDAVLSLKSLPNLSEYAEALPRVAANTPQALKLNAALDEADARLRKAISDCKRDSPPEKWHWRRRVSTPMRGPGFLSLYWTTQFQCGGAEEETSQVALTFDLSTGTPLGWERYLPEAKGDELTFYTPAGSGIVEVVTSPKLIALYRERVVIELQKNGDPGGCAGVYDVLVRSLMVWPDAKQAGLVLQPTDFPRSVASCSTPVLITVPELRRRGAAEALVKSIESAHAAGAWSDLK